MQLTLRDFTFHRPHHVQTLSKKTLELSYSQRILLRIRLTGLTVSSLLCKLKYFSQTFLLKLLYKVVLGVALFLVAQTISALKSEFINLSRNFYTKWSNIKGF